MVVHFKFPVEYKQPWSYFCIKQGNIQGEKIDENRMRKGESVQQNWRNLKKIRKLQEVRESGKRECRVWNIEAEKIKKEEQNEM